MLLKFFFGTSLAAFILLPSFFEILNGKIHSDTTLSMGFQFLPYQTFYKLTIDAFNFTEMEKGLPNIFLTSILTFCVFSTSLINIFLLKKSNYLRYY